MTNPTCRSKIGIGEEPQCENNHRWLHIHERQAFYALTTSCLVEKHIWVLGFWNLTNLVIIGVKRRETLWEGRKGANREVGEEKGRETNTEVPFQRREKGRWTFSCELGKEDEVRGFRAGSRSVSNRWPTFNPSASAHINLQRKNAHQPTSPASPSALLRIVRSESDIG